MKQPAFSLIVPMHGTEPHRAAAWARVRSHYSTAFPDAEIIEARMDAEPWRKGAALSMGATRANSSIFVISDADVLVDPAAITKAVALIAGGAGWVVPHRLVFRLTEAATRGVLDGGSPGEAMPLARPRYQGYAGGGLFVTSRKAWALSGGIPHEFAGWGAEDEALGIILDTFCGPHARLEYPLFHLWHPEAPKDARRSNRQLLEPYLRAAGDAAAMRHFLLHGRELETTAAGKVRMVSVADVEWRRGSQTIKPGDVFLASPDEARRHMVRRVKLAHPIGGHIVEPGARTIRVPTTPPSFEDQRLAAANARRKGQAK